MTIERLSGEGKVYKGQQFIANVHYDLQIQPTFKTTRTMTSEGIFAGDTIVQLRITPQTAIGALWAKRIR